MKENSENMVSQKDLALLLSLNEAVANIENTARLFQVLFEILKPAFRFDLGVIQIISEDRKFVEMFLPGISAPEELMKVKTPRKTRIPASEVSRSFNLDDPGILRQRFKDIPEHAKMDQEVKRIFEDLGIKEMLICPLPRGGKIIGHFIFANGRKGLVRDEDFPLLRQVARIVAGAVVNTVAYEQLAQKERETEKVLRFTSALLNRQDFDGFLLALATNFQDLRTIQLLSVSGLNPSESRCAIYDEKGWRVTQESVVHWMEGGFAGSSDDLRVRIRYLTEDDLAKVFSEVPSAISLFKRNGIVAGVLMRLDPGEFSPVTLFLGANEQHAEMLLIPGMFEQAAPQLLLAIRSLLNWERIQELQNRLQQENRALFEEISSTGEDSPMVGESPAFKQCISRARQVGTVDTTVLIQGETGTGKEVMAKFLHGISPRHGKPMVRVNCASLPSQLIESELFGHEKGAFTGAVERRIGKFELAQGGTIFLDEIGELPLESQAKLLRVLQEKEFERIGGKDVIRVDVRVLTATNRNLEEEVRKGHFRADLYFRLNVFPISIPPLRERKDDIPILAEMFLRKFSKRFGRALRAITQEEGELLQAYPWPGNIREMEHFMERSAITAIGAEPNFREFRKSFVDKDDAEPKLEIRPLDDVVKDYLIMALRQAHGKVSGPDGAASKLGLNGKTLDSKMRKYGIQRKIDIVGN